MGITVPRSTRRSTRSSMATTRRTESWSRTTPRPSTTPPTRTSTPWVDSLTTVCQAGLCHDQGMLHRTQEEGTDLAQVPPGAHQEGSSGGHQAEVHRHFLQDGPRSLPDQVRQESLHGTP